jgi:hypothetical protein
MRRQRSLAFIIAIALTASSTSAAERWRDKLPERKLYMPITVLLLNDVKTELKLTREQEQEIAKITEEAKKDVAIKYKELRDEGVDILRSDEPVRLLQAMAEIDYPATNRAYELVDESQQQRAVEITLQQESSPYNMATWLSSLNSRTSSEIGLMQCSPSVLVKSELLSSCEGKNFKPRRSVPNSPDGTIRKRY